MTTPAEPSDTGVRFGQPSGGARSSVTFGVGGTVAGIAALALLLGGLLWAGAAGTVASAAHPKIFGGSLVLEDQRPLTVIDVATGKVTVRLQGIDTQVGARSYGEVQAVPVSEGTMLVDRRTGTFNLLGRNNYVVDAAGPGVGLGALPGSTGAEAYPAGAAAYILRYGPTSTVSLVDESTVRAGENLETGRSRQPPGAVTPKGFADLGGTVADHPGAAAVDTTTGDLWVLVGHGGGCDLIQLHQTLIGHQGLLSAKRSSFSVSCGRASVETSGGVVAVATPGRFTLFTRTGPAPGRPVSLLADSRASSFLPAAGSTGTFWFLYDSASGWSVVGIDQSGTTSGPAALAHFGPTTRPVTPVISAGVLYTLDQLAAGQPELWRIFPDTGAMVPVQGEPVYPARGPTEKASFDGAQVIVDGPRVVFNNPGSLLAVVVFTDRTHSPVVVDKSAAVTVSATGPADLGIAPQPSGPNTSPTTTAGAGQVTVIQPVSKQVTCATTTQKPYAPQIMSATVSSSTALVAWSYELLDQTDCEPDSWSVKVTALGGGHQPDQPVQVVNGQNQLLFTGLRPATTYQAVVTAYINAQSTPSPPVTFTTAARGPDAPTSVSTVSDGKGDWVVSWSPCTASNCFVPADSWNVIGTACGSSYVGQPPTVQVPGNQASVVINADSLGLLGDSLSFTVQGSLASGLMGGATQDHACTEAWRAPDPNFITLSGSGEQNGQTITATLRVSTAEAAIEAFGSSATEFVYQVGGSTVGPTSATSATVTGLDAGKAYVPSVVVYPAGHPESSVTVTGRSFSKNLSWPANLSLSVQPSVDTTNPNTGTVQLLFANVPPGPMSVSGAYVCGSTQGPQFSGPLTGGAFNVSMDLVAMGGSCQVTATLSDQDSSVYGRPSDPLSASFTIGTQPQYSFTVSVPQTCQQSFCLPQQVEIQNTGNGDLRKGGNWKATTKSQGGVGGGLADPCASTVTLQAPPAFPYTLDLPSGCLDAKQVDVAVSWMYLGVTTNDDLGTPTGKPAPPPSTTTTTTTPKTTTTPSPPTSAKRAVVGSSTAGGLLVVAWFVRRVERNRVTVNRRQRKRKM